MQYNIYSIHILDGPVFVGAALPFLLALEITENLTKTGGVLQIPVKATSLQNFLRHEKLIKL